MGGGGVKTFIEEGKSPICGMLKTGFSVFCSDYLLNTGLNVGLNIASGYFGTSKRSIILQQV